MSLASNLTSLATRIATELKAHRVLINGNATDLTALTTTAKSNLVVAVNEVNARPAGATNLSGLSDVTVTTPATADVLRYNGTKFVNVQGTLYFEVAGAAAAAATASQPVDSDLTAIAALTTTSYGRAFLTLAAQANLLALFPAPTETGVSLIELATQTETNAGADDLRAVTPLKLQTRLAAYAQPLDSDLTAIAALAGQTTYGQALLTLANQAALFALLPTDTDINLASNSDLKVATQKATKGYVDARVAANGAMTFKGVIDCSTNPNFPAAIQGDTYRISVAGKLGGASGIVVEIGDLALCVTTTIAGTQAAVGANWDVVQTNLDGAVVGPVSAVSSNFAVFSGTGGKTIQDTGLSFDSDGTMTANSALRVPSQSAVRTYAQPLDSDLTAIAALTTTSYGRSFLDRADAAAARTYISTYSQTEIGDPTTDFVTTFNAGLV